VRVGSVLASTIDEVLRCLPAQHIVATHGDARFVAGPAGAFVLLAIPARRPGLDAVAGDLHSLALRTRDALCDHLTIVPFLEALLVGAAQQARAVEISVAPVDLLGVVLTEGPQVIDDHTLAAIRLAVQQGHLDGWTPVDVGDARIDLCDPTEEPEPTASHPL
jgi:hypothetical protein